MDQNRLLLEICVEDADGIDAAVAGGADRIELCSALAVGGLTPSAGLVVRAVASGLPVHAMVRPRPGDFVYGPQEIALMVEEIAHLRALGVSGVVVGATHVDGHPDRAALGRLRDAAQDLEIVLHRAIDLAPDPIVAVGIAADLGFDHVLSSGGEMRAPDGAMVLAAMVGEAKGRLKIIAGAGVRPDNVVALLAASGVDAVHASAACERDWPDDRVRRLGFAVGPRRRTSREVVAALAEKIGTCKRRANGDT
jgi:copper homeostasis protein